MKKYILVIVFNIFFLKDTFAQSSFTPWNSNVKVADENIIMLNDNNICANKHTCIDNENSYFIYSFHGIHTYPHGVYNGFQGGAYMLIRFFQVFISPQDGPNCRFKPTCSAYGRIAVERYGSLLGSILTGDRLLRCNPYYPHGYDPVPEKIVHGR